MSLQRPETVCKPEVVTFDLVLQCEKTRSSKHKELTFTLPNAACISDIKTQIERKFNIPVCVQTLSYESNVPSNDTKLDACRIRSGDTLHVCYTSEGECEGIVEVVSWMGLVLAALKCEDASVSAGISHSLQELLVMGIEAEYIEDLSFKYFFPWLDAKKYVNKLHYVHCGGLEITMELYALILRQPWANCVLLLKYVEYGILRILWNFSETFAFRRMITSHGGLQMCVKSLLRVTLEKGKPIEDRETPDEDSILIETIGGALGTLCNLAELPECHVEIASNMALLLQVTCITLTPSVRILSSQMVATLFLCVAYTEETHRYLANPEIIGRLLESCQMKRTFGRDEDKRTDPLLLHYFTQVFLAQLVLVSANYIPPEFYQQIHDHMDSFLNKTNYKTLMKAEVKHWYVWSTFLPYVKLVYIPETPQTEMMRKLQLLSLRTVLFALQTMLGRQNHREVLVREGLLDYVTCMPLYVPESLKPQAREVVQMLAASGDVQMRPPKLVSLLKAQLAKTHTGLEKILLLSVSEIVSQLWPS